MNATEQAFEAEQEPLRYEGLQRSYVAFLERWAPVDGNRRHYFDRDLMHLVHQIHREASKPYEKIMASALSVASLAPITLKKDGSL